MSEKCEGSLIKACSALFGSAQTSIALIELVKPRREAFGLRSCDDVAGVIKFEADADFRRGRPFKVQTGGEPDGSDTTLRMSSSVADRYFSGQLNIFLALDRGEVQAGGQVDGVIEIDSVMRRFLSPIYRARKRPSDFGAELLRGRSTDPRAMDFVPPLPSAASDAGRE